MFSGSRRWSCNQCSCDHIRKLAFHFWSLSLTFTAYICINQEILEKLYDFNHRPENHKLKDYMPGSRSQKVKSDDQWGGGMSRRVLEAIYAVAFLCLLRADEVLKIQRDHVELFLDPPRMVLTLPFRKTHQDGGKWSSNLLLVFNHRFRHQAICVVCNARRRGPPLSCPSYGWMD